MAQAFPEHPRSIPDRSGTALQHCGGQHFTLSAAKVMGPAEDFAQKPTKAWAMMFTSRQSTGSQH